MDLAGVCGPEWGYGDGCASGGNACVWAVCQCVRMHVYVPTCVCVCVCVCAHAHACMLRGGVRACMHTKNVKSNVKCLSCRYSVKI